MDQEYQFERVKMQHCLVLVTIRPKIRRLEYEQNDSKKSSHVAVIVKSYLFGMQQQVVDRAVMYVNARQSWPTCFASWKSEPLQLVWLRQPNPRHCRRWMDCWQVDDVLLDSADVVYLEMRSMHVDLTYPNVVHLGLKVLGYIQKK